jgi:hypothetical protein
MERKYLGSISKTLNLIRLQWPYLELGLIVGLLWAYEFNQTLIDKQNLSL